jgi:large subunit ribosomal protein L4e
MAARPTVSVYSTSQDKTVGDVPLPAVFTAPIRNDVVQFVHTQVAKNSRQAYAVNRLAGMNHSAESWGTGRAVARIPRISGSGTQAGGAGAFGNMCRGGRMFAPTKIYRRWHRKVNLHQKRFAVVSALAASAVTSLVQARGHKIENVAEVPLVVEDSVQSYAKTRDAVAFLEAVKAMDDVNRVADSRQVRAGRGKMRNRRYVHRRGPLLVLPNGKGVAAFRNVYGLDTANVTALNLLHLAPGGHLGRFIIWSKGAFEQLDKIFGTFTQESAVKKGFVLPAAMLTNTDITRILRSEEVRRALKPKKLPQLAASTTATAPTNGVRNRSLRQKLNPFAIKLLGEQKSMRNKKLTQQRRKNKGVRLAKAKKAIKALGKRVAAKKAAAAGAKAAPKAAGKTAGKA